MDIMNCRTCGKMFNHASGPPICTKCKNDLEDKFVEVKAYIYDHKGVGIHEVSEEMEVSVAQIKQWVREERLAFSDSSDIGIDCESCGRTIKTGRFCKSCKDGLTNEFKGVYAPPVEQRAEQKKPDGKGKMRFLR